MKNVMKILSALLAVLMLCGTVTVGAGALTRYDENGNAILRPILFKSTSVDSWDDVTVTITL